MLGVLSTLALHGIKINYGKCKWFESEVDYLGHRVGVNGIAKSQEYIDKVNRITKPVTVKELRQFLGLINFNRKFLPHCSSLQKPLSCLTGGRGSKKLVWTEEMDQAFHELKHQITRECTLSFPDYSEGANPLQLWVDASGIGAGACLGSSVR